jgi:uncharacterized protein YdhG (YjbR/CyaY superfamily)
MTTGKPNNIEEYIAGFPQETQEILEQVRATIKKVAPEAEETISYGMPSFTLHKTYLVYFAAFKNHIGFYPTPSGIKEFEKDFATYKTGKGSIQFPLDKPMPADLISRIVKFRIQENIERAKTKRKK